MMGISPKLFVPGAVMAATLTVAAAAAASAQDGASSAVTDPAEAPVVRAAASSAGAVQAAPSTPPPRQDLFGRDTLTGDWNGTRTRWKAKGVELDSSLTQIYQGVASGGVTTGSEYNGSAQATLKFDLGRLAGWKFWSAEVKGETRFGGPLLGGTGALNPVNTMAIVPGADGTVFSVTAANLTRLFPINLQEGKLVAVSFGRYNLLDLLQEDFFAGVGIKRFMNMAQIGPLTALREVPLITNAVTVAYVRRGEPFITFAVMDPNDQSTDPGLSDLFADGVTFAPTVIVPVTYFGKSAKHSIGGAVTTKAYTPFDAIRQIIIPGPPIRVIEPQRGSWSLSYTFRQYIVERGKADGWGAFSQVSLANQSTSPIAGFFDIGLGGNGLFDARPHDEFGISYAYTSLSDELKENIDLRPFDGRSLQVEHQLEVFYNLYLTPWFQLTGDLQVVRPTLPGAETAVVPAVRLRLVF
jgi:porin